MFVLKNKKEVNQMPTSEEELKRIKEQMLKPPGSKKKKSKAVKKKEQAELKAAKARLEKAQAKYVGTFAGKYKKGKAAEQGKLSEKSKRNHRWKDWRTSDGKESPVIISNLEEKE
jgi:hypothetical protein